MNHNQIEEIVYNFPTESKFGFTNIEIKNLLEEFENVNIQKFNNAMFGNTCMSNDRGEIVSYHRDVLKAVICGLENRDLTLSEWD